MVLFMLYIHMYLLLFIYMYISIAVYFYKSSSSEKISSFFSFLFLVQMKTRGRSGALHQPTLARLTSN